MLGAAEAALAFVACERHAHLVDAPDAASLAPQPTLEAGPIPALDSGLGSDAYAACADRRTEDCQGPNDFPCGFDDWIFETAESCQTTTGCKTNGWLEVKLSADGCVVEIGMDQPNDAILSCLLTELGATRCPCSVSSTRYYFGSTNTGPCRDGGPLG